MKTNNTKNIILLIFFLIPILSINIKRARAISISTPYTQHPILFVHGNNLDYGEWVTMVHRFIDDGWPATLLFAKTFSNPSDDTNQGNINNAYEIEGLVNQILEE